MGLRGKHTKIWVDGYALEVKVQELTPLSITADEIEESGYTQDHSTLKGQFNSEVGINGYFSTDTGETHDAMKNVGTDGAVPISAVFGENAAPAQGDLSFSLNGEQTMYEIPPDLAGVIAATAAWKQKGDPAELGILLADQAGVSANSNTPSADQSAQSSNGGVGYLHITGVSAGDTLTVKIQDSANDADWADLITFTLDGSSVDAERATVSGMVDRYVRALWTVSGTGIDFDFAVMWIRK